MIRNILIKPDKSHRLFDCLLYTSSQLCRRMIFHVNACMSCVSWFHSSASCLSFLSCCSSGLSNNTIWHSCVSSRNAFCLSSCCVSTSHQHFSFCCLSALLPPVGVIPLFAVEALGTLPSSYWNPCLQINYHVHYSSTKCPLC